MEVDVEAAIMLADVVVNITSQSELLDSSVIAMTTTLVENLTQMAIQQPEVLTVIKAMIREVPYN